MELIDRRIVFCKQKDDPDYCTPADASYCGCNYKVNCDHDDDKEGRPTVK